MGFVPATKKLIMKKSFIIAIIAALPAFAQQEAPTENPAPQPRHWGAAGEMPNREEMKHKMLEKFDADKDGQLSDAEKEAIKAEMKNRHGKRGERPQGEMPKFGNKRGERPQGEMPKFGNKRGECPQGEMPKFGNKRGERPQGQMPQQLLEKFDTDKDGQLSDTEKEAMKDGMKKRLHKREMNNNMLEKFDTDKDGKLSDEEKKALREARPDKKHGKGPRGPKGGNKRGKRPAAPQQGADVPTTLPL